MRNSGLTFMEKTMRSHFKTLNEMLTVDPADTLVGIYSKDIETMI